MGLVYLGTVRDFAVHWIDPVTGDLIDLINATMEIARYDSYGGEVFVLDPTPMEHLGIGHYLLTVELSPVHFMDGERYFVRFRGRHPISGKDELMEETFTIAIDPVSIMGGLTASFVC